MLPVFLLFKILALLLSRPHYIPFTPVKNIVTSPEYPPVTLVFLFNFFSGISLLLCYSVPLCFVPFSKQEIAAKQAKHPTLYPRYGEEE